MGTEKRSESLVSITERRRPFTWLPMRIKEAVSINLEQANKKKVDTRYVTRYNKGS